MKALAFGIGVALLLGTGCGRKPPSGPAAEPAAPGNAPLAIPILQGRGETMTLDSLRGQVVLVDFCATWSAASRQGVEQLNGLRAAWGEQGLAVIGLCVDKGDPAAVSGRVGEWGADYPIGWAGVELQKAFGGIRPIPTRILLDPDGKEVARFEGAVSADEMEPAIRALMESVLSPQS
jgi:thiol-disulfide isomerase/thioredoxin